jgi:hypothetical protein
MFFPGRAPAAGNSGRSLPEKANTGWYTGRFAHRHLLEAARGWNLSKRKKSCFKECEMFRRIGRQDGASTVEFALIAPMLFMLIFGLFQFGIAYNNWLAITHAAREGARLAAVGKYSEQVVRSRAYPVQPDSVTLAYPLGQTHGQPVQVKVRYNLRISIPFFGDRELPLASQAEMRLEV